VNAYDKIKVLDRGPLNFAINSRVVEL